MNSDMTTTCKLMVLYLLKKVSFPMTNSQLAEFFTEKEYTEFFHFQTIITELCDANLVQAIKTRKAEQYEMTREGEDALYYFGKKLSPELKESMDGYIREHKYQLRDEVNVSADYYPSSQGDFVVHGEIREGKSKLLTLELSAPTQEQADALCDSFEKHHQDLYAYIIKKLFE